MSLEPTFVGDSSEPWLFDELLSVDVAGSKAIDARTAATWSEESRSSTQRVKVGCLKTRQTPSTSNLA